MKILLRKEELDLLRKAAASQNEVLDLIVSTHSKYGFFVEMTEDEMCNWHECCCDYLAIFGFDKNYQPNYEGKLLEGLIDKFYDLLEKGRK